MDLPRILGTVISEDISDTVGAVEFYVLVILPPPSVEDAYNFDPALPEKDGSGRLLRSVPFVTDYADLHPLLLQRDRLPRHETVTDPTCES